MNGRFPSDLFFPQKEQTGSKSEPEPDRFQDYDACPSHRADASRRDVTRMYFWKVTGVTRPGTQRRESGIHMAFPGVKQLGRSVRKLDGGWTDVGLESRCHRGVSRE